MVTRSEPGQDTQSLTYDAEKRVIQVQEGSATIAAYTYDGDNNMVKAVEGDKVTVYIGSHTVVWLAGCEESTGA
jgi:YD repeat-containing protein